ncbi:MAG: hypothetical protein ACFCUM_06805 [Bacteroidales bacterium]
MYSESYSKSLNYKLRELEIIIRQLNSDDKPAMIDVDLALEKTRELYEILMKLDTGWDQEEKSKRQFPAKGKHVVPPDPETDKTENVFQAEEVIPDPVREHKDNLKNSLREDIRQDDDRELHKSRQSVSAREEIPESKKETEMPVEKKDNGQGKTEKMKKKQNGPQEIEIVADRYLTSQNYINQAMANKQGNDISSRSQSKPVADLRSSIGLNDKFLFIKELFSGRPDKYNQCIDNLNQASSFEEAIAFIEENCSWEEGNEVAEKLLSLVKRRHQTE